MKKEITRWGVGPKFTAISVIYAIIIFIVNYVWLPDLFIPLPRILSLILGAIFIVVGLPVFLIPAFTIDKYFEKGKLATAGIYGYFRHPIYASWIVFFVPGIVLFNNSLIGFTIPIFMYLVFRILIVKEEKYLEKKFGWQYLKYRKEVGAVSPKVFHFV